MKRYIITILLMVVITCKIGESCVIYCSEGYLLDRTISIYYSGMLSEDIYCIMIPQYRLAHHLYLNTNYNKVTFESWFGSKYVKVKFNMISVNPENITIDNVAIDE